MQWWINGVNMRYAKHFDKDLYSKWHRTFEKIAMIDIDSVEICQNKGCWQPLALIETVYDTGNYKKYTNSMRWLGKAANLPCFLVFYKKMTQGMLEFKVQRLSTLYEPLIAMSEEEWVAVLRDIQEQHQKVCKHGHK